MQVYEQQNATKIRLRKQGWYQKKAQKMKVRCKLHSQNFKSKHHSEHTNVLQKGQSTYHSHKEAKEVASEKLRQQDPRARKVMNRKAIKKAIGKKFRFGKDHVLVQNYEGKWIKVEGRRFYRVYIVVNHPKRISFYSSVFHRGEVSALS